MKLHDHSPQLGLHTTDGDSTTESPLSLGGPLQHLHVMSVVLNITAEPEAPVFITKDGPGVVVPMIHLVVLDALIDEAKELLIAGYRGAGCCLECGGSILAAAIEGTTRGTCRCSHNRRQRPQRRARRQS
jgi:hypothetical protein